MKKILGRALAMIAGLILGGIFAYSVVERSAYSEPTQSNAKVRVTNITYYDDVTGYLALPTKAGTYPAVVLIPEWWGLTDDIKALAIQYAGEGYVAFVVDLYRGEVTDDPLRARELSQRVLSDAQGTFANLRGAVDFVKSLEDVDASRVASVGWGLGGTLSYQLAWSDLGTRATVMYYGQFNPYDDFSQVRSNILGHFGEDDTVIKGDAVRELQIVLKRQGGQHEIYTYPFVGYGFANAREGNTGYNKESAELAWFRTMDFLRSSLK